MMVNIFVVSLISLGIWCSVAATMRISRKKRNLSLRERLMQNVLSSM